MNRILIFVISSLTILVNLEAKSIDSLIRDFQNQNFKVVCKDGMRKYSGGNRDEDFLGMVGVACAEIDSINPLGILQKALRSTKAGRNNASYFATLILQKKLIYQFMLDDIDLGYLRVPETGHILSVVFKNLVLKNYKTISKSPKRLEIRDGNRLIKVYVKKATPPKVVIDIYKDGEKVETHWYR